MENCACPGGRVSILYAVQKNGKMPAEEYFDDNLTDDEQNKFLALFKRYVVIGMIRDSEKFKKLEGELWEFKYKKHRLVCFEDKKGNLVLTHGFLKQKQKTPRKEIERAKRIMLEHLERTSGENEEAY